MTVDFILPLNDPRATLELVGGKGASLARLKAAGLPVPDGFHLTTAAYDRFVAVNDLAHRIQEGLEQVDAALPVTLEAASSAIQNLFAQAVMPPDIAQAMTHAYAELPGDHPVVAVRSSATAEDLPGLSFAGQQETFLNIHGSDNVQAAVKRCWASLWTARAIGYRAQHHIDHTKVSLAVVVQILIEAEASGVLFTANPINGRRDQAMITATWGLGEALVGGLVTPDTLVVDKATGKTLSRETADKQVMTVLLETSTDERPVPETIRRAPVLTDEQVAALTRYGAHIEKLYGLPLDIEWTLAEGAFAIVQARPITALPEPEASPPTEWKLPKGAYAAVRNNIVELMADPLSPLFATLGLSAINTSLHRLLAESFAMRGIMPNAIILSVNGYAYNNGSLSAAGLARVLFGSPAILREMFTGAVERWTEAGRPRYYQTVAHWQAKHWRAATSVELVDSASALTEAAIDAYGALVSGVIPAAWITEAVFTTVYDRLIKRRDDPAAPIYLLGFDSLPIRADKSLYDLADWARGHPVLKDCLERTPTSQLVALQMGTGAPGDVPTPIWQEWRERFGDHLKQFGHTLYDLDFAHPLPADDPAPVLEAFKLYLRGQGVNPHTRQQEAARRREQAIQATRQRLHGWRLNVFNKYLALAQKYAPLREDGLAEIGLAYPLIRQRLRELGRRFVQHHVIGAADDIFWLTEEEVRSTAQHLDAGQPPDSLASRIPQRKADHQAALRVAPPVALPQMKVFGFDLMSLKQRRGRGGKADVIKGVACSAGRVTGTACVLNGPEAFSQMKPGDVLVAAITTPAWTPLFAMASAVVTDVGGPLSHGSIVAREYGIPAVLGTGVATRRIHSGDTVTVDGTEGKVFLQARGAPSGETAIEWRPPNPKGIYMRTSVVDLMPNPLSPLYSSWAIPLLRAQMKPLGARLGMGLPVLQEDYYTAINSYAYMNAAFPAKAWWWILTGMLPAYPTLLRNLVRIWRDELHPEYQAAVAQYREASPEKMSAGALWQEAQELLTAAMYYACGLLFATMGASAGSEGLLTRVYDKFAKREGDPEATVLLMGWDNIPVRSEKSLYDLAGWIREVEPLSEYVLKTTAPDLVTNLEKPASVPVPGFAEFAARFKRHLESFGHLIFQMDFAEPLPSDRPEMLLETIKLYVRGQGTNPHDRQRASEARRLQTSETIRNRLKGWKRWVFGKALNWGQSLAEVREDALAEIGLGYPTLRARLYELGGRLVRAGAIQHAEDIFWLEKSEVADCVRNLDDSAPVENLSQRVAQRQAFNQRIGQETPPPMIPMKKRYLGIETSVWLAESERNQTSSTLKGVAASGGSVTAPACVIHGPEDFNQMRPGAVLVAGTTTPAWTPLFVMASAVVTDIGGPLSHGSIVAREYGIPAVMGTGVATRRIHSGEVITVDGSAGVVTLSHNGRGASYQPNGGKP